MRAAKTPSSTNPMRRLRAARAVGTGFMLDTQVRTMAQETVGPEVDDYTDEQEQVDHVHLMYVVLPETEYLPDDQPSDDGPEEAVHASQHGHEQHRRNDVRAHP